MRHGLYAFVLTFVLAKTLACGGSVTESSMSTDANTIADSAATDVAADVPTIPTMDTMDTMDTTATEAAPETGGAGRIRCGDAVCAAPARCEICRPGLPDAPRICTTTKNDCLPWGEVLPLRMSCDDHSDCAPDARCAVVEGSDGTYTQCVSMPTTDCKGFAKIVCSSLADCPPCATRCAGYRGDRYPVSTCQ